MQITYNGFPDAPQAGKGLTGLVLSPSSLAIYASNSAGLREVRELFPERNQKQIYLSNGRIFSGTSLSKSSQKFLAHGQPITAEQAQRAFQQRQSQLALEENWHLLRQGTGKMRPRYKYGQKKQRHFSQKYFRARNRASALQKAQVRRRKQIYHVLANQILETADEIRVLKTWETDSLQQSPQTFQMIQKFAPDDFLLILRNKMRYRNLENQLTLVDKSAFEQVLSEKNSDLLYQAFLLTQVHLGQTGLTFEKAVLSAQEFSEKVSKPVL